MKRSGTIVRVLAVLTVALALVGLEFARQRSRHVALKKDAPATGLTSGIECFDGPPEIIRPVNTPAFVDVTHASGIDFSHAVGPLGTYFMPESVGTGGAFFDYDGDGRLDVYLVQSARSPDARRDFPASVQVESRLYRQTEHGTFEDTTRAAGLAGTGYGAGCAIGDIDNNGHPDVYVTRYEQDSLYLNNGDGSFSDVTKSCGISEKEWGACAAFFDYNRDGLLDLVVVNYTADPTYGHSVACGFRQGLVSYCGPHKFQPTIDHLYRNDGVQTDSNGLPTVKFTDVTEAAGLGETRTFGFGVVCADVNSDGWPDIFVANDGAANRLWINQKNGTFLEEAAQRGCAMSGQGSPEAGMGIAIGDVNHDQQIDLVVTHLSGEKSTLYLGTGNGYFEDSSRAAGMFKPTSRHTGWGAGLIDLNHDGELDFALVNGLVIPCHSKFPPHGEDQFQVRHDVISDPNAFWRDYADQNVLLLGTSNGSFRDATEQGGDFCGSIGSGRALIHGDIDNDGDVDLLVTHCGGKAKLYRNDLEKTGHWLMVRAVDPRLKRDAYGAEITVRTKSKTHFAIANPGSSFLASNDFRVHFGLGDSEACDEIVVKWPDGPVESATEVFEGMKADRLITLQRGSGRALRETP